MGFPIHIPFIALSLAAALLILFKRRAPFYLKLFPFFLLITLAVEIAGWLVSDKNGSTIMLYNIFTSFEFVFYLYILRFIINSDKVKRLILSAVCIYPFLSLVDIVFLTKPGGFHSETYALGCFLVDTVCIYYFFELFQLSHSINLLREPPFWICSALLFFYCCSFPFFGLANFFHNAPSIIKRNIDFILTMMNILLYSSFTVAFLCRIRTRKSIV